MRRDLKKFPCKILIIKQKIEAVYNERELPFVIGYNWISDQIGQKPAFDQKFITFCEANALVHMYAMCVLIYKDLQIAKSS